MPCTVASAVGRAGEISYRAEANAVGDVSSTHNAATSSDADAVPQGYLVFKELYFILANH
jgi:hypothetical protein